jgi:hypothetical protein
MSTRRWVTALAPSLIGVVVMGACLSVAIRLRLGTVGEVMAVVIAIPQAVWWISFGRNRLLGREADGAFRVVAHPLAASLASGTGELKATLRRTAHRSLVVGMVIELVVIGVLLRLHPSLQAAETGSGNQLGWVPVIIGVFAAVIALRVNRAARGAAKVIDGPSSTLFLTTEVHRRRYLARFQLTPDDDATVAELRVVYTNPQHYMYVNTPESATVYGSLEPGTAAVAIISRGMFIGRISR